MKAVFFPSDPLKDAEWTEIEPEKVLSGRPMSAYKVLYTSPSEEFFSGVYECTTGKWRVSYTEDEFCTLIEGVVRLMDERGVLQEFKAPASFLIPAGFTGTWESATKVRKFFVIYQQQSIPKGEV